MLRRFGIHTAVLVSVAAALLLCSIASADVEFIDPTPPNGSTIYARHTTINASITSNNLTSCVWNWNGANTTPLNDSCVLYLSFNNQSAIGDSSSVAVDVSQHNNNGSLTGGVTSTLEGRYNGAFAFDESIPTYVRCEHSESLNITYEITLEAWIKASELDGSDVIISKGPQWYIELNDSRPSFTWVYDVPYIGIDVVSPDVIELDKWYHIVGVYDRECGRIYVDGIEKANMSVPDNDSLNLSYPLLIGSYMTSMHVNFNGTIDEARIYNRALTPEEIKQAYKSNLWKYNQTQWYFKSKQTELKLGEYHYQIFANNTSSKQQWITISIQAMPVSIFIALTVLMLCGILYMFHAKTHISRIFTTLIATWMAFMLSQMIVSGNVVQMVSALNSADVWTHDTVAIQIPALSYLLLFIGVILSIFLVKFVVVFGLAVIKEAQREEM